ncbi:hypothetical protein QE412_001403 [Microbacterium trichothecenolyticum]|uniref:Uncharacterized protein n=1 Tax=Microbacterium trichothecenolyticum TaxID=69370 RepID=A0ABU0TT34_MICTR|nr:hypothetical protein [Microbacterium trichothecenolyticum]
MSCTDTGCPMASVVTGSVRAGSPATLTKLEYWRVLDLHRERALGTVPGVRAHRLRLLRQGGREHRVESGEVGDRAPFEGPRGGEAAEQIERRQAAPLGDEPRRQRLDEGHVVVAQRNPRRARAPQHVEERGVAEGMPVGSGHVVSRVAQPGAGRLERGARVGVQHDVFVVVPRRHGRDTDPQESGRAPSGVDERTGTGGGGGIRERCEPDERVEQQPCVLGGPRDRARDRETVGRVEARTDRQAAARRLEPDDADRGGRDADGPAAVGAHRRGQQARRDRDRSAAAGPARPGGQPPRVARRCVDERLGEPGEPELGRARLSHVDGAGGVEGLGERIGCRGHEVRSGAGAIAGGHAGAGDEVFVGEGDAPQRPARGSDERGDATQGGVRGHLGERAQIGEPGDAVEVVRREVARIERAVA